MTKGLLLYPPTQLLDIEIPKPDGSLGLLYLASALEQNGIEADILDANVGPNQDQLFRFEKLNNGLTKIGMPFNEIAEYASSYDFVVMTSNFTLQTNMVIKTSKTIKKVNPEIKIYIGGVNARALRDRFLRTGYFDGICLTDGEIILPKVILEGIENVPGFAYAKNGKIIENPITKECFPNHLDDLPIPKWYVKNYDIRDVTDVGIRKSATILTSRGCNFRCLYCHNSCEKYINRLRLHSINRVLTEVNMLKNLGVNKIYIEDESLLSSKLRTKKLFKLLKNIDIKFLGPNGINLIHFFDKNWNIDIEYLEILRDAGLYQIAFPIESGSQRILDKYCPNKINLNKMNVIELMKTISKMEIKAPVNIIIGFPDETEEEIQQSIEIGRKLKSAGASYVSFFLATPFPGSKLYNIAIQYNYLDKNFNPDIMNWKKPIMKNTTVPPERLIELQRNANEKVNDTEFINDIESKTIGRLK